MEMLIDIKKEKPDSPKALQLIKALSIEIGTRYGEDGTGNFNPNELNIEKSCFVIAWHDQKAVGCGAVRPLENKIGEVKGMYVVPEMRGKGVSKKILIELEKFAKEFGYEKIWLETGVLQPEAVGLYEKDGYKRIKNYGIYFNNPLSICFEKLL